MEAAPQQWRPGVPVTDTTPMADIAAALAFGQSDDAFNAIAELLKKRNCITVADWKGWLKGEFLMMVKLSCGKTKKHRNAYLVGFESATGVKLELEVGGDGLFVKVKKQSGGDTTGLSAQLAPSENFMPTKWLPDLRVYEGVPKKCDAPFLTDPQEKLYLDLLWLAAQVRPRIRRVPCAHASPCT